MVVAPALGAKQNQGEVCECGVCPCPCTDDCPQDQDRERVGQPDETPVGGPQNQEGKPVE